MFCSSCCFRGHSRHDPEINLSELPRSHPRGLTLLSSAIALSGAYSPDIDAACLDLCRSLQRIRMTSWHEGRSLSVCAEAGDVDIHWAPCQSLNGGDQGCKELQQTHVHIEGALTKSMPCSIYCGLAQAAVHLI